MTTILNPRQFRMNLEQILGQCAPDIQRHGGSPMFATVCASTDHEHGLFTSMMRCIAKPLEEEPIAATWWELLQPVTYRRSNLTVKYLHTQPPGPEHTAEAPCISALTLLRACKVGQTFRRNPINLVFTHEVPEAIQLHEAAQQRRTRAA